MAASRVGKLRRRRQAPAARPPLHVTPTAEESNVSVQDGLGELDAGGQSLLALAMPTDTSLLQDISSGPEPGPEPWLGAVCQLDGAWFSDQDSWRIEHRFDTNPTLAPATLRAFFRDVNAWMRDWATQGHNVFIHARLYADGLPDCLQDAYSTLVTYLAKNDNTEDMVLQIVEGHAKRLNDEALLAECLMTTVDVRGRLARTQALLVYTVIRLFDGCPRQRAQAEVALDTLDKWHRDLYEAASRELPRLSSTTADTTTATALLYEPTAYAGPDRVLWRAWILCESIRRTWLVCATLRIAYMTMTTGSAGYCGSALFTARRGLWDATSAVQWRRILERSSPLFTSIPGLCESVATTTRDDLDQFSISILLAILPPEEAACWKDQEGTSLFQ